MSKENSDILYYRKLKDKPLVQICDVPCIANLKLDYFTGKFAAITEEHFVPVGNKKSGIYSGFLYENRKIEFEFYDESFADDKKYTKEEVDNMEFPLMYYMPVFE